MTIDYNAQNGSGHIQNVNSMINSFSRFPVFLCLPNIMIFFPKQTKDEMLQGKKYNNPLCLLTVPHFCSILVILRRLARTEGFLSAGQ